MVGVPTIFIVLGVQFWTCAVILILEAIIIKKGLGIKRGRSFGTSFLANFLSFIIAVPLSRGFLAFLMIRLFNTYPAKGFTKVLQDAVRTTGGIQIPELLSICFSFFIAFIFSVILEYYILRLMVKEKNKKEIQKITRIMNGITYVLIVLVLIGTYNVGYL